MILTFLLLTMAGCSRVSEEELERLRRDGLALHNKGDFAPAAALLDKYLRHRLKDYEVYWALADSYEQMQQYDKAVHTWQKFLFVASPTSDEAKTAHQRLEQAQAMAAGKGKQSS